MDIQGRCVFITGASSGIGKACAEQFAKAGCRLILTARRLDRLEILSQELSSKYSIQVLSFQLDVRDNSAVEALVKQLDCDVDILVNNAGLALASDRFQDGKIDNWETMIDTNVKGLLYVTKALLPRMLQRNKGHIINIGSVAGHGAYAGGNVYCATKHAVKALTQCLRTDLFGTSLRVSEVSPGAVETEFSEVRWNDKERAKKFYHGFEPLLADDIADAVVYCATRPPHVNVAEIMVYPQAQSSLTEIYREGDKAKDLFSGAK